MKNYLILAIEAILLTLIFSTEPPRKTVAQIVSNVSRYTNTKKSQQDVVQQEELKQRLFQQAFRNQDTVMVLINKKKPTYKPKVVHIVKKIPVYIPVTSPESTYIAINRYEDSPYIKTTNITSIVIDTTKFKIKDSVIPKHTFFYRIFH